MSAGVCAALAHVSRAVLMAYTRVHERVGAGARFARRNRDVSHGIGYGPGWRLLAMAFGVGNICRGWRALVGDLCSRVCSRMSSGVTRMNAHPTSVVVQ